MGKLGLRRRASRSVAAAIATFSVFATLLVAGAPAAPAATPPPGSAGALDSTFGSAGVATLNISGVSLTSLTDVVAFPAGCTTGCKYLVGGLQPGTAGKVTVAQLNSDGSLDTGFGSGGSGGTVGYVQPGIGSTSTQDGAQIARQSDGRILVTGGDSTGAYVTVARLNANGTLDTSFGTKGLVKTKLQSSSSVIHGTGIVVLPNADGTPGKILVSAWAGSAGNFTVLRYTSAGALDTTFGSSGIAQVTTAQGKISAQDLAVDGSGRIVVAGVAQVSGQNDVAIARFSSAGAPDANFPTTGKGGVAILPVDATVADQANAVSVSSDGNAITLSGTISSSPAKGFVRSYALGGSGLTLTASTLTTFDAAAGSGGGFAAAGGKVLLAGGAGPASGSTNALGVARLNADGTYDTSFGVQDLSSGSSNGTGRESVPCASGAAGAGTAVTVQADGRIVTAGACGGKLTVARLGTGNLANLTWSALDANVPSGSQEIHQNEVGGPGLVQLSASAGYGTAGYGTAGYGTAGYGTAGYGTAGYGTAGYGTAGYGTAGYGTAGYGTAGYGTAGYGTAGYGTPVDQSPLMSQVLGPIPISELGLSSDILVGTSLEGVPAQSVTVADVAALPAPNPLSSVFYGAVNKALTKLRLVSNAAILLGLTPISSLPAPSGGWCNTLTGQPASCESLGQSAALASSLVDLELRGDTFGTYYSSVPIDLVGLTLVKSLLPQTLLNNIDMTRTTLGATKTLDIPAANRSELFTCTASSTAGQCDTLASVLSVSAFTPTATLGRLLQVAPAAVGHLVLANLMAGMIPPEDFPVEATQDLSGFRKYAALPTTGARYRAELDMGCDIASSLVVTPSLPAEFRIIPSTVAMTIAGAPVPTTVGSDGSIRPTTPPSCSGTQHVVVDLQAEPGVVLGGPLTSGVTASAGAESLTVSNRAPVTIVDSMEGDDAAGPANKATWNEVRFGHISHPGDVDTYDLSGVPVGSLVTVTLSHIPAGADFDLFAYGPATPPFRQSAGMDSTAGYGTAGYGTAGYGTAGYGTAGYGTAGYGTAGYGTAGYGTAGYGTAGYGTDGSATAPPLDADAALFNLPLRGYGTQRGNRTESVSFKVLESDASPFLLEVAGYNGSSSNQPYVLHIAASPSQPILPCSTRTFANAGQGITTLSTPTSVPADTQTLILVNQKRFGDTFGAASGANLATKLQNLAAEPTAKGAIVPTDDLPQWGAWDGDPCSITKANAVVAAVNARVDAIRAASGGLPQLRYITIVGSDELFPFGRVPDLSDFYNESRYSQLGFNGHDNAESRAAKLGYLLTDNVYGDFSPTPFMASQLAVPQVAVGRLVETDSQIFSTIDAFVSAHGHSNTANQAFVTGYNPFDKGSQQVSDILTGRGITTSTKIDTSPAWNRQDAVDGVNAAAHGYLDVNAHYDYHRGLPEAGIESDSLVTTDLPASLAGAVGWTIGCHAGLSVPDAYVAGTGATGEDWAQAFASRGATSFTGNTGYGLGDTDVVTYSEKMTVLFAKYLDGSASVGQALMLAKQDYLNSIQPNVYDHKAITEMTYYGLPMWLIGPNGQAAAAVVPPAAPATPPTITATSGSKLFDAAVTPFQSHTGSKGTFYTVGDQPPLSGYGQAATPLARIDATSSDPTQILKGVVVESLTSHDVTINPSYGTVDADLAAFNAEPNITEAFNPTMLATNVGTVSATGRKDTAVFAAGQFYSSSLGSSNLMRLFDKATLTTLYDNDPKVYSPTPITGVTSAIQGSSATITMNVGDTTGLRALALVQVSGQWRHCEMVNAGGGTWVCTLNNLPTGSVISQYIAQYVNAHRVVSWSSNKGQLFNLQASTGFTFSLSTTPNANGLYTDPTDVTICPPPGVSSYTVTLDGVTNTYTGCTTVHITGNGGHVLTATANGVSGSVGIPMDSQPPITSVSVPASGATYYKGQTVTASFSCTANNVAIVSCSGPTYVDTSAVGSFSYTVTIVDAFGVTWTFQVPYTVVPRPASVMITSKPADPSDQSGLKPSGQVTPPTVRWAVANPDGASIVLTCKLDGATVPCGTPDASGNGSTAVGALAPQGAQHTFTITVVSNGDATTATTATGSWKVFYDTTTAPGPVVFNIPLTAKVTFGTDGSAAGTGNTTPLVSSGGYTVDFYTAGGTGSPICSTSTSDSTGTFTCGSIGPTVTALGSGGVVAKLRPTNADGYSTGTFIVSQGSRGLV